MSARGKCRYCGDAMVLVNVASLRAHQGLPFDYWRSRMAAAFGVAPVADELERR